MATRSESDSLISAASLRDPQRSFRARNGRYGQVLMPGRDDKPSHQAESFVRSAGISDDMRNVLEIDSYNAPEGDGYVITLHARESRRNYSRRINVGPEAFRSRRWTQV
jgi:hypothetical protein